MADLTIEVIIPEENIDYVRAAFDSLSDNPLLISNNTTHISFTINGMGDGEARDDFDKRFIKKILRQVLKLNRKSEDITNRYNQEIRAVAPPSDDIPDAVGVSNIQTSTKGII